MLDEGEGQPVERKQLDIFKITRDYCAPPVVSPTDLVAVSRADNTDHACASDVMPPTEWKDLIAQLRQMATLSPEDYRKALKQMWRRWHPDKNSQPYATHVFRIIQRHADCFANKSGFEWLDDLIDVDTVDLPTWSPSSSATADDEYCDSTAPTFTQNSYFDEFKREAEREETRQQQRNVARASWVNSGSGSSVSCEPRIRDYEMADRYETLAVRERRVSAALSAASEWAACVWHAQQAVELMVKALMFRTCGITDTELKGKGAHDVALLLGRLMKKDDGNWPVAPEAVDFLSNAYIGARYGPDALGGYTQHDAEAAQSTAKAVLDWAMLTDSLRAPAGGDDGGDDERVQRPPRPAVFDPVAPPPPSPPRQPSVASTQSQPRVEEPVSPSAVAADAAPVRRIEIPGPTPEIEM
jgi:HEPN domain-containing protein